MLDYSDLCSLMERDKEFLIALIGDLIMQIDELEAAKPISLPELPPVGQYVISDAKGDVLMVGDEDKFLAKDMEVQALMLSMCDYLTLHFYFNGESRLLSEWSNGKRVAKC